MNDRYISEGPSYIMHLILSQIIPLSIISLKGHDNLRSHDNKMFTPFKQVIITFVTILSRNIFSALSSRNKKCFADQMIMESLSFGHI